MTLPGLKRLWRGCAALTLGASFFVAYLHACERSPNFKPAPMAAPSAEAPVAPAPEAPAAVQAEPRYTFVGPVPPFETAASTASATPVPGSRARAAADTMLSFGRQAENPASLGAIPDFDIRLAGVDLQQIMQRYGYLPAIKTRDRLVGKIVGAQFVPLRPQEISRYARRGRSGAEHPEAETWRRRVAAELNLAVEELQFIFLVPHATEEIFIAAEIEAIQRAGKSAAEIALVHAHFQPDLTIAVDALVTKTGELIPLAPSAQ